MYSAELNVPPNHVYLFKPQRIFDRINREVISRRDAEAQRGFCGIIHTL